GESSRTKYEFRSIKKRLKRFRPVVLRTLRNGSRYWIGDSAQAHLMRRSAKLSPRLRLLRPEVGKRTLQGKMQGKAGESSYWHVNRAHLTRRLLKSHRSLVEKGSPVRPKNVIRLGERRR